MATQLSGGLAYAGPPDREVTHTLAQLLGGRRHACIKRVGMEKEISGGRADVQGISTGREEQGRKTRGMPRE